jgi:hypothetical protein
MPRVLRSMSIVPTAWDRIRSMPAGEDRRRAAKSSRPHPAEPPLRGAALAAGLLEEACAPESGDPLRLEVVRTLARDLAEELEALSALDDATATVEGALRAADVANLAACTAPELLETAAPRAVAAAHLAAGAVRALGVLADAGVGDAHEEPHGEYKQNLSKDARGAVWRAQLAVRQVDEFMETG